MPVVIVLVFLGAFFGGYIAGFFSALKQVRR